MGRCLAQLVAIKNKTTQIWQRTTSYVRIPADRRCFASTLRSEAHACPPGDGRMVLSSS